MSGTGDTGQDLHEKDLDVEVTGAIGDEEVNTKLEKDKETKTEQSAHENLKEDNTDENPQVAGQGESSSGQSENVETQSLVKEQNSSKDLEERSVKIAEQIVSKVLEESTLIVSAEQRVTQESEPSVTQENEPSVTQENEPSVTQERTLSVTEQSESEPSVTEQSVTQESEPSVTEQSEQSVTQESEPSESKGAEKTEPKVAEQSESKVLETPAKVKEDGTSEKYPGFIDVLGNGTLLKKMLEAGSGNRPNMGDEVIVYLVREIPEIGKTFSEEQLQYVLGEGDVVQALDLSVALMDVGEKAMVLAGFKYMYGEQGIEPDIPPRSNFKLTVNLIKCNGPLDYTTMSFNTRFGYAKNKKDRGNEMIKRKDFVAALNSYTKASKIVDAGLGSVYKDETPESLQELLDFRAVVLCNASFANFKLEAYDAAIKMAKEACSLKPGYSKSYCRMAQAQEKKGDLNDAIRSYRLAIKHDTTTNKFFQQEIDRLQKVQKEQKQSEKDMYSKMFWGSKPPEIDKPKEKQPVASLSSWLWSTGATVVGAGLVSLAGIGVYKYLNH